jgi:hypothetical protein
LSGRTPRAWELLARALAARHVPAFQAGSEGQRGRPRRAHEDDEAVVFEVHRLLDQHSVRSACSIVAKKTHRTPNAVDALYRRSLKEWKAAADSVVRWRARGRSTRTGDASRVRC